MTAANLLFVAGAGLAEGAFVGTGLVAFLTVLGLVPRLCHLTGTGDYLQVMQWALVAGPVLGSLLMDNTALALSWPAWVLAPLGLTMGIFFGMVTGALAEVLDVLPVVGQRFGLVQWMSYLVALLMLGKTMGSLIYWLIPALQ